MSEDTVFHRLASLQIPAKAGGLQGPPCFWITGYRFEGSHDLNRFANLLVSLSSGKWYSYNYSLIIRKGIQVSTSQKKTCIGWGLGGSPVGGLPCSLPVTSGQITLPAHWCVLICTECCQPGKLTQVTFYWVLIGTSLHRHGGLNQWPCDWIQSCLFSFSSLEFWLLLPGQNFNPFITWLVLLCSQPPYWVISLM